MYSFNITEKCEVVSPTAEGWRSLGLAHDGGSVFTLKCQVPRSTGDVEPRGKLTSRTDRHKSPGLAIIDDIQTGDGRRTRVAPTPFRQAQKATAHVVTSSGLHREGCKTSISA